MLASPDVSLQYLQRFAVAPLQYAEHEDWGPLIAQDHSSLDSREHSKLAFDIPNNSGFTCGGGEVRFIFRYPTKGPGQPGGLIPGQASYAVVAEIFLTASRSEELHSIVTVPCISVQPIYVSSQISKLERVSTSLIVGPDVRPNVTGDRNRTHVHKF